MHSPVCTKCVIEGHSAKCVYKITENFIDIFLHVKCKYHDQNVQLLKTQLNSTNTKHQTTFALLITILFIIIPYITFNFYA
jgi:hypothetical protein